MKKNHNKQIVQFNTYYWSESSYQKCGSNKHLYFRKHSGGLKIIACKKCLIKEKRDQQKWESKRMNKLKKQSWGFKKLKAFVHNIEERGKNA